MPPGGIGVHCVLRATLPFRPRGRKLVAPALSSQFLVAWRPLGGVPQGNAEEVGERARILHNVCVVPMVDDIDTLSVPEHQIQFVTVIGAGTAAA